MNAKEIRAPNFSTNSEHHKWKRNKKNKKSTSKSRKKSKVGKEVLPQAVIENVKKQEYIPIKPEESPSQKPQNIESFNKMLLNSAD